MDKPFAITLDIGTSRADKTGSYGRPNGRSTPTGRLRATTRARPVRTCRPWLYEARSAATATSAPGARSWKNPFPAIMGRVCYHPCETACNRGQLDEAVGINSVERFVGDEAIRQGWRVDVEVPPPESTCWSWVRDHPSRGGVPPRPARTHRHDQGPARWPAG